MSNPVKKLFAYLEKEAGRGQVALNLPALNEAKEAFGESLSRLWKEEKTVVPRSSGLNIEARRMWLPRRKN